MGGQRGQMFNIIAKPEYSKILVGHSHKQAVSALERVSLWTLNNSLITSISALQGAGKTHLLYHLRFLSQQHLPPTQWVEIIAANEQLDTLGERGQIDAPLIISKLLRDSDDGFVHMLRAHGFDDPLPPANSEVDLRSGWIMDAIRFMKTKNQKPFGLMIAIDGVDEYVRNVGEAKLIENIVKKMLINVRLILDLLDHTCIVLAVTESVLRQMDLIIEKDPTFNRRYVPLLNFDGTDLDIGKLTLDETFELCLAYRNCWISEQSNNGHLYVNDKEEDWPFESVAIELAWKASKDKTPRSILEFFQEAENILSESTYKNTITIHQMAKAIDKRAKEINIDVKKETRGILKLLLKQTLYKDSLQTKDVIGAVKAFMPNNIQLTNKKNRSKSALRLDAKETTLSRGTESSPFFISALYHVVNPKKDKEDVYSLLRPTNSGRTSMGLVVPCVEYNEDIRMTFSQWYGETRYIHAGNHIYILLLNEQQKAYIKAFANDTENKALRWIVDHTCGPSGENFSTMVEAIVERALRGD